MTTETKVETHAFQAEVGKLLDIVAHSLYSQKEIFLRELISNASDACDKLRYRALTEPKLIEGDPGFRITLSLDKKTKTLTVSDNGVGMDKDELTGILGTIARSGTQAFVEGLSGDGKKDKDKAVSLIGQFGVGFYSAFMVADLVEVVTRKAGTDTAVKWASDGRGEFTIEDAARDTRGTDVIVHLKKDEKEYLEPARIEHIVRTYSDHIGIPIVLAGDGKDSAEKTLNTASAIWTRDKKDVTDEQYTEFYHHAAHAFDDPWMTLHNRVEGVVSYTNLLFIPSMRPFDLFHPDRTGQVKLYVKRVFITDNCEGLLPPYLRFVKGVVDSEDLALNVSREMMQHNPVVAKISQGLTKRIFGELKKSADKKPEDYQKFWETFGPVLKEGLYEDGDNREKILELARFKSSERDGWISLADYVAAMKDGQDAIFYISGEDPEAALASPQLEGFKAKGVEVLLMTDPVDEFWLSHVGAFQEKAFKSATRGGADLAKIAKAKDADKDAAKDDADKADDKTATPGMDQLIAAFKVALGDKVKDVRPSERLTDSAVCLVADDGDMDINLERLLKQHKQLDGRNLSPRILELNPDHALVTKLAKLAEAKNAKDTALDDAAFLLLDQARILEGEPVIDAQAFSRRLSNLMAKGLA
ncbi:MAG TPA: molecular chaperone HtpG [Rhodospirillaceae bacterium]|nr:molecular chaperone HtpG [Rhodospirillaceae bacterium]|tara:strand:- start:14763 stop:16694 length:1932 start_codon:yes stop_codon:yes gene_type:complete